jgi:hypothetical protein
MSENETFTLEAAANQRLILAPLGPAHVAIVSGLLSTRRYSNQSMRGTFQLATPTHVATR